MALALLLVGGVAGAVWLRVELVERLAARALAARGLSDAALRVESVGLTEARVADLRLAPGARAEAVRLRYGLYPPRLAEIEIEGLYLDVSRPDQGVFRLLRGESGAGGAGELPAVALADARIEADTPQGRLALALSGRHGPDGGAFAGRATLGPSDIAGNFSLGLSGPFPAGRYDLQLEIDVGAIGRAALDASVQFDGEVAAMHGELKIDAPTETLGPVTATLPFAARLQGARISARVEEGEAAAPERKIAIRGLAATLDWSERIALSVAAREATTGVLAPLAIEARTDDADDGAFELSATAAGVRLGGRGRYDISSGVGELRLVLPAIAFTPGGLQPAALAPALAAIEDAEGRLSAGAALRWSGERVDGSGELRFQDLSFGFAGARLEGVTGAVRLARLLPPVSAPRQTLRARRLNAGASLEDVQVTFRLDGEARALDVDQLDAGFAGGRLVVANARYAPLADRNRFTVQVHDVDLGGLLALVGLEELSGEGRVNGLLPLVLTPDDVLVENGELATTGRGVLRFRSQAARQALAPGGQYVELALQALENFRYERLSLELNKAEAGRATARLSTLGANPDVLGGHPFAINVTLNADANELLEQAMAAWRLSQGALATIVGER